MPLERAHAGLVRDLHERLAKRGTVEAYLHREIRRGWDDEEDLPHAIVDGFCFELRGIRGAVHATNADPPELALVTHVDTSGWVNHSFVVERHAVRTLVCGAAERAALRGLGLRRWVDMWVGPCPVAADDAMDTLERAVARDWRVLEPADLPEGVGFPRSALDVERLLAWDELVERELRGEIARQVMGLDGRRVEVTLDRDGALVRSEDSVTCIHHRGRFDEPFVRWCVESGVSLDALRPLRRA